MAPAPREVVDCKCPLKRTGCREPARLAWPLLWNPGKELSDRQTLLSFVNRHVRHAPRPDIFGARTNQLVVGVLFKDVRGPAADAADRKDRSIEVERNSHHVVSRS